MEPHNQHRHIRWHHVSIINILVTIPTLFATAAYAIPTFTAAADIPNAAPMQTQIPPATTSTYTVTKISSTTLTTSSPVLHISPHILSLITTMTVTTYEPWPAFLLPDPTTVLESVVSSVTWVERRRYLEEGRTRGEEDPEERREKEKEETTITRFVVTTENTWVVHPAGGPTDGIFFAATGVGVVGCGGCSLPSARPESTQPRTGTGLETRARLEETSDRRSQAQHEGGGEEGRQDKFGRQPQGTRQPQAMVNLARQAMVNLARQAVPLEDDRVMDTEEDPVCKSTNLTTGCQGQCIWKPSLHSIQAMNTNDTSTIATGSGMGTFWCLHIHPYHYADPSLRMGRACWGPYLRYRQLNAPCLVGDVGMACFPCVKGGEGEAGKKDESWDAVFWEGEE